MASEFKIGDLVWAKIEARWWPGYIYDESLANSTVIKTKTKGCLLVAFFGDDTYSWIRPNNVLPYEPHFLSKSKQSKSESFTKAIEDAVKEVKQREEVAFFCKCRKPYDGYKYSVDQVESFRREFNPAEMVSFLHKLALEPMDLTRDGHFMRNEARFLAYRTKVFTEVGLDCPSYKEAFEDPDGYENSNVCAEALLQGDDNTHVSERAEVPALTGKRKGDASTHVFERAEVPALTGKRKGSSSSHSRPNKVLDKSKRVKIEKAEDGIKLPKPDFGKASGVHVSTSRQRNCQRRLDSFLDKEALVSKPKSSPSIALFEKGIVDKSVDPPKSQNKGKELASAIVDKQALITKSSKLRSSILLVEKSVENSVKDPHSKITIVDMKLASLKCAEEDLAEPGAILHIKFPSKATLPSTSELKAKFARFGQLDTSVTYSSLKSPMCHVGFKRASDAKSARDHLHSHGNMYNSTKVSFWLEDLKVNPSPKSSDRPKVLGNTFRSEGGRTEKYQQAFPPPALPSTPVLLEASSRQEASQLASVRDKKHLETSQAAIDISRPMLKLLNEVYKYMEDLKRTQKH